MTKPFDLIKIQNRLVLVTSREQIGLERFLLKGLLIGRGFENASHEDLWLEKRFLNRENAGHDSFIEFWNESIFCLESKGIEVIDSLTTEGRKAYEQAYEKFCKNHELTASGRQLSDSPADPRHLFQANEKITAAKLSLPAKKYVYLLSDITNWELHENAYLKAIQQKAGDLLYIQNGLKLAKM